MVFKKIREKRKLKLLELNKSILNIIGEIINDDDFKTLRYYRQHIFFNRYEHLINTSILSYKLARFFKADVKVCTLAGVLHDYHFTKFKTYKHGVIAAENSKKFGINIETIKIIESHMYPFGRKKVKRASGKNFWVLKIADSFCAIYEFMYALLFFSFSYEDKIKLKKTKILLDTHEKIEILLESHEKSRLLLDSHEKNKIKQYDLSNK